jgi:hypothetical protein
MFFKNKTTGLVHKVTHPDHIKRCQNDKNYEEVKQSTQVKAKPKQTRKTSQRKSNNKVGE